MNQEASVLKEKVQYDECREWESLQYDGGLFH